MVNLRILKINVRNSTQLDLYFTHNIGNIGIENISIISTLNSIPNLTITSLSTEEKILTIRVRPMVPRVQYQLVLNSTSSSIITGSHGERMVEDGATNHIFFVGQVEDDEIRDQILGDLPPIYNINGGTLIFDTISPIANQISTTIHKTNEIKSSGYVSLEEIDELKIRGSGPYDRLNNEGAYQLIRAGLKPTGSPLSKTLTFSNFPSNVINLKQVDVEEEIISNTSDDSNKFEGLIITLSKQPVIKLLSLILTRDNTDYVYDIEEFKYGILNNKFDLENSYSAFDINENQIKLSSFAIGSFPIPQGSDVLTASYIYAKEGRLVNSNSVKVSSKINVTRESVPAVSTSFFLKHAPILNSSGSVASLGGISWLSPSANFDPDEKHPSFTTELKFNPSNLPKTAGEYTINYNTGQVIVYGTNGTDGTTTTPPVATYTFEKTYQDGLDYIFSPDLNELVALPNRDLIDDSAEINFKYEDNFAEGVDFNFLSHIEVFNERVNNNLIENIGIRTQNYPITEVFRIYNETSGEVYFPTRINGNEVYFNATVPPVLKNVKREYAQFAYKTQSQLTITDTITIPTKSFYAYRINLENSNIISATEDYIGASFNTSLNFTKGDIFSHEFYYDPNDTFEENLLRLQRIGDYMVDYNNGIIYLATNAQSTDIGEVDYKYGNLQTRNSHIIRADNVYRSVSSNIPSIKNITINNITDEYIELKELEQLNKSSTIDEYGASIPIVVASNNTITIEEDIFKLRHIYQVTDLQTHRDPIDFGENAIVSSSSKNIITLASQGVEITDDNDGYSLEVFLTGSRKYIIAERIGDLHDDGIGQIISARGVFSYGVNYYTQGTDGYVESSTNRIYLPTTTTANVGDLTTAKYSVGLRSGAGVLIDYSSGDLFVDYTYSQDQILISYEYGDNILDWSISSTLNTGDEYYISYKYGALRNSLRDNFGVLTGIPELSVIPEELDRETYRNALKGTLQSFVRGPTIPSIEGLVEAFTDITPIITETAFLEWILGRDFLNKTKLITKALSQEELPEFSKGKFSTGLLLDKVGQTATIPTNSNLRLNEGTWENFITPNWNGLDNDAVINLDLYFDDVRLAHKIFIGAENINPDTIPFKLDISDPSVLGLPSKLHTETGYFIWFDLTAEKWRIRMRAPISENRFFKGNITTSGEFYDVSIASTADGYAGYDGYEITEENDTLRSTDQEIKFSFMVDAYDYLNISYDAYDSYGLDFAGFDGIDFSSGDIHYIFDIAEKDNENRISLYKDGKGFIRYRVWDSNRRVRQLSADISNWLVGETHHIATSWKINTIEGRDELHLFIDGKEVPNTYKFGGLQIPNQTAYMDEATEVLTSISTYKTISGSDLQTTINSNIVSSASTNFLTNGINIGDQFIILDDTLDGILTKTSPYVYISDIIGQNQLELESDGNPFNLNATLNNVKFSVNPKTFQIYTDPINEKIRLFSVDSYGTELELYSPNTLNPDYEFLQDGYENFVSVYNSINYQDSLILKTYGLKTMKARQFVYIWSDNQTNILNAILPIPTSINNINITKIISKKTTIEEGVFTLIATPVGVHIFPVLISSLTFCQPSNSTTGRRLSVKIAGSNIDFDGLNQVFITGNTTDGYGSEMLSFTTNTVSEKITNRYFTSIDDVVASFTPIDGDFPAGVIEIKEALPINKAENGGDYAEIRLSVQEQAGIDGQVIFGDNEFYDGYARFGAEDIGKILNISYPLDIAGSYKIEDVLFDPSQSVKDSQTAVINTTWSGTYSDVEWKLLTTSYSESGFANGLITLEIANSGGEPYLLKSCWYEISLPVFMTIPFNYLPKNIYIGSDYLGNNQVDAVLDEIRILDEMSDDTGRGEVVPSSGRSITTDYQTLRPFEDTIQTLSLFHFDDNFENSATFRKSYDGKFRQSENSVNENFGHSIIFNQKSPLQLKNKAIFQNKEGTIEFWISPILDTYNDPTDRYYIDLTPEQVITVNASGLNIALPVRARSISKVSVFGLETNFYAGGTLSSSGQIITLGQPIPPNIQEVQVTYVPITSQGDRFSVYKNKTSNLVLLVSASGQDYQITTPIYWKRNTWHRVFIGWNLNNTDNQDRLIMLVDGSEGGIIRYGTGLRYGTGIVYGQPTIWGSANAGTTASRNILADINMLDNFNVVNIGADFTGQFTAMARMDNIRFSSSLRNITYLGGTGVGKLLGKDLLYTSNINSAQPVIEDALTRLLLDFDNDDTEVEHLTAVRDKSNGIFDFYVDVIDSFDKLDTDLKKDLLVKLINRIKPAHTRAFVSFK